MKILILGGDGMQGHQLLRQLAPRHDVRVTLRQPLEAYASLGLFRPQNAYGAIELRTTVALLPVFAAFRPEALINAVGIVKQRPSADEAIPSLEINSLLPHRLALACRDRRAARPHAPRTSGSG
jgi:dTDP-4-dehydrorhamnose reductase